MKLTVAIDDTTTSFTVDTVAGLFVNCGIIINSEIMKVTNINTLTLTVERGYKGSTKASHLENALIYHFFYWTPYRDTEYSSSYPVNRVEFSTGGDFQSQRLAVNKGEQWTLPFQGIKDEMTEIKAFCDARFGSSESFYWYDTLGILRKVKLINDSIDIVEKRELQGSLGWVVVAYTLKNPIVIRKVS